MEFSSKIVILIAGGLACSPKNKENSMSEIADSVKKQFLQIDLQIIEYSDIDSSLADLDFFYDLTRTIQRKINCHDVKGNYQVKNTTLIDNLNFLSFNISLWN